MLITICFQLEQKAQEFTIIQKRPERSNTRNGDRVQRKVLNTVSSADGSVTGV